MFRSLIHFEFILCMLLESILIAFFYKWFCVGFVLVELRNE